VAVCPGFKVTGEVIPVAPNSEPATEMEEIVTAAVPEDISVTNCVPVVPTATFPNDTDEAVTVRAATPDAGESVMENVCVIPPACAVIVAVCAVDTLETVALNRLLIAPDFTVTLLGTFTSGLLLVRVTVDLAFVFVVRYTVHASVPAPR